MAISMTGFGRGEYKNDNYHFIVECRTINHKYVDINVRLPRKISFLEDKIRNIVKDYVKRGRVDLYIKLDLIGSEDVNLKFDEKLASQYVNILNNIKSTFDLNDDITVMNIAKFPDIIKCEEKEEDADLLWGMLKLALAESLKNLKEMRCEEGIKLSNDIDTRCDLLKDYIEDVEKYSYNVVNEYKEKLNSRIAEILENPSLVDENRLAQEVAIYADKCSITEEIVRFKSHITQLKKAIHKDESIGRKIDFLIQEMNRETNTIGSKSSDLNITNLVVEIKSELEKIREQIQNIE
ncbi:YicC-like domain-containing protein [[Clostridium] sordellii]|uniref:YicC/YloC family endoribonuclease n=1 Tax=Paraclostridium sordellii TaxID=1505 RepID=UPI0005E35EC4|nr:YicC/YloC family endoribonuclease [Paeniclostridium sordellii]MRZ81104.1 YicC family protein [Paeniclostridium sordellii]MSB57970.1 YicC family protein [Paeniclostridium sordellii]CEN91614.1 YicC-like domain-containing protein [[Clostridium] sordellii] [Paeniclostridium sordellii]CEO31060.1 YicC-like domain-containing protein [[Clostridium] sordellii] [Paeniclostridium sordellii]CEP49227.1 YicC-like domain-containing protein [[Clostridium] sordellii] [Paeniclostridium sordellii]